MGVLSHSSAKDATKMEHNNKKKPSPNYPRSPKSSTTQRNISSEATTTTNAHLLKRVGGWKMELVHVNKHKTNADRRENKKKNGHPLNSPQFYRTWTAVAVLASVQRALSAPHHSEAGVREGLSTSFCSTLNVCFFATSDALPTPNDRSPMGGKALELERK